MKKILGSILTISALMLLVFGASSAFFSDTETSADNVFTAGALDLKVDNNCTYNGVACDFGQEMFDSWTATDLGATHKFFYFTDVKPGDFGEDTVSLHVDNDAWLRLLINNVTDADNNCTEPEGLVELGDCGTDGEMRENLLFTIWLDHGETPGFQGLTDTGEGDNVWQDGDEPVLVTEGPVDAGGEILDLADAGLYLLGGETAYFGISWELPDTVGDEVQTDSMTADMEFQVQQHRNNPTPVW